MEQIPAINRNPFEGKKSMAGAVFFDRSAYSLPEKKEHNKRQNSNSVGDQQPRMGKEAKDLWRKEKNSGNKESEVNAFCSPKIPSVNSSLNELIATNSVGEEQQPRVGKEAKDLWRKEKNSGNKKSKVNAVCSSKIPFVNSSLNELIGTNKKESNLIGPTKAPCKGSSGFWYSNKEEEEMGPTNIKDNGSLSLPNEALQQSISLGNKNKRKVKGKKRSNKKSLVQTVVNDLQKSKNY
uniref:Uncharacterized protein n=1 Tax=Cucumis sativus TaxID=3659 RepID=A0A0A0L3L4_CUCSA